MARGEHDPIVVSEDEDQDDGVIFVRQKRLKTHHQRHDPPANHEPIVVSEDEDQDDGVVFVSQKRLKTHHQRHHQRHDPPANHDPIVVSEAEDQDEPVKHEPVKDEPVKHEHEPVKDEHEAVKHEPVKHEHEPVKNESIKKGDLSDEDLNRFPRRTTRTKRTYYGDEASVQSRSNSIAPPLAEWISDSDDEFNMTTSSLPVLSASRPRRSIPGSISGPVAQPETKCGHNSDSERNPDSDDEFNITPVTLPVPSSSLPSRSIPGSSSTNALATRSIPSFTDCFIAVHQRPPFPYVSGNPGNLVTALKRLWATEQGKFHSLVQNARYSWAVSRYNRRIDLYADFIKETMGSGKCFTGMFHAFPNVTITQCLQLIEFWFFRQRRPWAKYAHKSVNFYDSDNNSYYKCFMLTKDLTVEEFVRLLARADEMSHLCNFSRCINPLHIVTEPHDVNRNRERCFKRALFEVQRGTKVNEHCDIHDPPCLLHVSAINRHQKLIEEYQALGNDLSTPLPPQVFISRQLDMDERAICSKILTENITIAEWVDNKLITREEIQVPAVGEQALTLVPEEMIYRGPRFQDTVKGLMLTRC